MNTYMIGFIVCAYAFGTHLIRRWQKEHPAKAEMPIWDQFWMTVAVLFFALIWPICLAVWMRDIREEISKR